MLLLVILILILGCLPSLTSVNYCLSFLIRKYLGEDTLRLCLEMPCFSLIVIHQLAFLGGSCLRQLLL